MRKGKIIDEVTHKILFRPKPEKPLYRLENVVKTYQVGNEKINAIVARDINIPRGKFIGLIGENGSGKTTLAHILAGLLSPDKGKVIYFNERVGDWEHISNYNRKNLENWRRTEVGIITQRLHLVGFVPVAMNLAGPLHFRGVNMHKSEEMSLLQADKFGLKSLLKKRASKLSGGEQQQVAVSRAMITEPQVIIADEPTASLSLGNAKKILNKLTELNEKGRTVIMISHDRGMVKDYCSVLFQCQKTENGNIVNRC